MIGRLRRLMPVALALCALGSAGPAQAATRPVVVRFGNELSNVVCPTATECVATDGPAIARFDPTTRRRPTEHRVDREDLSGIACPAATQCTAVDEAGDEVTFDPRSPRRPRPVRVAARHTFAYGLACPSTTQCTATDNLGDETTFNPQAPGAPVPVHLDSDPVVSAVACPSLTQCTLVDTAGQQITFNPAAPTSPSLVRLTGGPALFSLACPSAIQCTAIGKREEVTFDPAVAGGPTTGVIAGVAELEAIACPALTQCTAVARVGGSPVGLPSFAALSFDPAAFASPVATLLGHRLPSASVVAVSCPAAARCTAVFNGEAASFDPASPGVIAATIRVRFIRRGRIALACSGASACAGTVTVDGHSRRYRIAAGARGTVALPGRGHITVTVAGGLPVVIK